MFTRVDGGKVFRANDQGSPVVCCRDGVMANMGYDSSHNDNSHNDSSHNDSSHIDSSHNDSSCRPYDSSSPIIDHRLWPVAVKKGGQVVSAHKIHQVYIL